MTDNFITIDEIAEKLCIDSVNKERYVRDFMLKHGIKMFRRSKGLYVRQFFEDALQEEMEKCLRPAKSAKSTMSGEQFVLANRRSKSQKGLLDFAKQAMQENMLPA